MERHSGRGSGSEEESGQASGEISLGAVILSGCRLLALKLAAVLILVTPVAAQDRLSEIATAAMLEPHLALASGDSGRASPGSDRSPIFAHMETDETDHGQGDPHGLDPRPIAMVEGGARFHTSPPLQAPVHGISPGLTGAPIWNRSQPPPPSPSASPRGRRLMLQVCSLSLLLCILMLKRWSA